MLKNKEFRRLIIAAAGITVAASVCGYPAGGPAAAAVTFFTGILITLTYASVTARRYRDIGELNTYLEKVLAGGETPNIQDQEEGELSMLKTNIYKAATTLRHQNELLAADKRALSDAIADISHQLKTPLTSMMVMNDLLKTEEDADKRLDFLETTSN